VSSRAALVEADGGAELNVVDPSSETTTAAVEREPAIASQPWADTAPAVSPHVGMDRAATVASLVVSALNAANPTMVRRITAVHPHRYTNL
jgi:hypothetical protein